MGAGVCVTGRAGGLAGWWEPAGCGSRSSTGLGGPTGAAEGWRCRLLRVRTALPVEQILSKRCQLLIQLLLWTGNMKYTSGDQLRIQQRLQIMAQAVLWCEKKQDSSQAFCLDQVQLNSQDRCFPFPSVKSGVQRGSLPLQIKPVKYVKTHSYNRRISNQYLTKMSFWRGKPTPAAVWTELRGQRWGLCGERRGNEQKLGLVFLPGP